MSAKAKPAHRMRPRALAATFSMKGGDKAGLYRATSGHSYEQGNHWRQTGRFDCGVWLPIDQDLTGMMTGRLAERRAA